MAFSLAVLLCSVLVQGCYKFPADMKDPCEEKECHYGAHCRPSLDGRTAECVCPEKCATYGDSRGSRPVCGSDGLDYPNVCELRRNACKEKKDIVVKFQGRCDPCDGVECPASQVCQLDDNRNPICRCNAICSPDFRPVCGSDGKTYINECTLRVEACKSRRSLRIIYSGECSSGANPCENLQCGPSQECDIDRYGIATCQCPLNCEPVMRPVCGSDGRTYHNDCELRRQACQDQRVVGVEYRGLCGTEGPCFEHKCNFGSMCIVKEDQPNCECPICSEEYEPVCGSDGISYTNECKLKREACEQMKVIAVAYHGLCSGCENKHCEFYAVCESEGQGLGRCICPHNCVKVESTVCGTDGVSYKNECEMRVAACQKDQYVMVASRGPCDLCQNVHCKYGARCENGRCICPTDCPDNYEPVCANDGSTYQNECEMRRSACRQNQELSALFYGECEEVGGPRADLEPHIRSCELKSCRFGGMCDYDSEGMPQCVCGFRCPSLREPVCGSDGRLYDNDCRLREESCRQQYSIQVVTMDRCGGEIRMVPCEGEPPLKDPLTGHEYFCGEGFSSRPCPPNSYCHKASSFATCCREVAVMKSCVDSTYGCCPDGKTSALGQGHAGCPSVCNCNRLGSYAETCDPINKQCPCKNGVGGLRCDRCEPGFWGLHKIAEGNSGCVACGCNLYGSVRDDCEQMTGRCVCKHGIQGMKCDICPAGTVLGPDGCMDASLSKTVVGTCSQIQCRHGANCKEKDGRVQCVCDLKCSSEEGQSPVCGSDGNTYTSECQLRLFSCRYQKPITARNNGPCKSGGSSAGLDISPTVGPVRRSTVQKTTVEQFESKSTRDVSQPETYLSTGPTTARPPVEDSPVEIPSFSGHSYLELPRLQAYTRLSLELEFRTFANDGILLYNGQTATGAGDFVSLALKDGFVEFRYNLGSGPVVLRSPQRLQPGRFHRLVAKRYLRDGVLTLDGQEDVAGHSEGTLKSLDLGENLFLGYVPTQSKGVFENIGINRGLIGCIRRLRVGRKEVNLHYPTSKDIIQGENIRECRGRPCNSLPCQNGGTCIPNEGETFKCVCAEGYSGNMCQVSLDPCASHPCTHGSTCTSLPPDSFTCTCPKGHSGKFCEHRPTMPVAVEEVYIPDFDGQTFIELPTLQNVGQAFTIEVWFLSRSPEGMLFYNGQSSTAKGDFISINLVGGYIQFRFDLGSGYSNITSVTPIILNQWHVARVTRIQRRGSLQMDDGPVASGESKEPLNELNLELPLYVGGYRHISTINPESGVVSRFNGAIQRIVLNGQVMEELRRAAKSARDITHYYGPPCIPNPCNNGGTCLPQLNHFHCRCPVAYSGLWCEKFHEQITTSKPVKFDGNLYLNFPNKISSREENTERKPDEQPNESHNRFDITFRTENQNGLLLWTFEGSTIKNDYLAVAIVDGFVELSFNLGKERDLLIVRHSVPVSNKNWHRVIVDRNKRHGMLQIDDSTPVVLTSAPGATELNTDGILWIGGAAALPQGLPSSYYKSFVGCIHSVIVDGEALRIAAYGTVEFCSDT